MTYNIQLTTRDGQKLSFDCAPDQNLTDAADAAHIILPAQCRKGSCGSCHASVVTGDFLLGEHNPAALPDDSTNGILMCCTTPQSDLAILLPYDHSRVLFHSIPRRSAEIVAVTAIAENTVRLQLRLDADEQLGSAAEFEPGQFMEVEIPDSNDKRAYSLSNTGNWDGCLEFLIRLQPNGKFSAFLNERACPGMKLMVRGPQGAFGIEEGSQRPRWFVAGGTGVAPMFSMLRRMVEYQEPQEARLFFGVNRESELFALDELERLKAALPQMKVEVCVWKPQGEWKGFTGTPTDALRQALADTPTQPDIYLCGPPQLIDAAEKIAAAFGIPAEQIISERYLPG
jgi:ferredoxin-NADP reductase/ferredoxin